MRNMIVSLLILALAGLSNTAHARGMGAMDADKGHTEASSDLGGEYIDEDDSTTDDLGSENLDEGDVDPADEEMREREEE